MTVGYLIFTQGTYMLRKQTDIDLTWINRNRLLTIQSKIFNQLLDEGSAIGNKHPGRQISDYQQSVAPTASGGLAHTPSFAGSR
jgi:hypothetical protein